MHSSNHKSGLPRRHGLQFIAVAFSKLKYANASEGMHTLPCKGCIAKIVVGWQGSSNLFVASSLLGPSLVCPVFRLHGERGRTKICAAKRSQAQPSAAERPSAATRRSAALDARRGLAALGGAWRRLAALGGARRRLAALGRDDLTTRLPTHSVFLPSTLEWAFLVL